jgi:hypothetical protein
MVACNARGGQYAQYEISAAAVQISCQTEYPLDLLIPEFQQVLRTAESKPASQQRSPMHHSFTRFHSICLSKGPYNAI